MNAQALGIKALTFDVFGTVVDWHGSVAREVRELARNKQLRVNAVKFAKAWRAGYRPAMDRVRRGEAPFQKIDAIFPQTPSSISSPIPKCTSARRTCWASSLRR